MLDLGDQLRETWPHERYRLLVLDWSTRLEFFCCFESDFLFAEILGLDPSLASEALNNATQLGLNSLVGGAFDDGGRSREWKWQSIRR